MLRNTEIGILKIKSFSFNCRLSLPLKNHYCVILLCCYFKIASLTLKSTQIYFLHEQMLIITELQPLFCHEKAYVRTINTVNNKPLCVSTNHMLQQF